MKEIDNQMQEIQRSKSEGENYLQKLQQLKGSRVLFNTVREEGFNTLENEEKLLSSIKTKDLNLQELSKLKKEIKEKLQ